MWDTLIGRQIRRSSRNLIAWNAILFIGVVIFFIFTARYYYNFFLGPFPMTQDEIAHLQDDHPMQYFVAVNGDFCRDTGVRHYRKTKHGRKYAGNYMILDMKNAWLVVKAKQDVAAQNRWEGSITRLPGDVQAQIMNQFGLNRLGRVAPNKPILPLMIDATGFRLPGYIGLAVAIPLVLLNFWNISKGVSRLSNMEKHPLARALQKYGDPSEVAEKIQAEYDSDERENIGSATLTRSWMIHPKTFGVDAVFLGDAVWTYKSVTQHYHNGIPTGKTYFASICDIHGGQVSVQLKNEAMCDQFVRAVAQRVPWVMAGYDKGIEELWKKNKPAVFEMAEQRRKDLMEELRRKREEPPENEPPTDQIEIV